MDKSLWRREFSQDDVPLFPCPHCNRGPIYMDKDTLLSEEATYSITEENVDWEPDWIRQRFVVLFRCQVPKCGEIVAVSGERRYTEQTKFKRGNVLEYSELLLRPHNMFPAPHIISLPHGLPRPVGKQLLLAFEFFWLDFGACANRLRTSLERLLDEFDIGRVEERKGRERRVSLAERIIEFQEIDKDHAKTFDALRHVGNVGTHDEDGVTVEALLDAFKIYESALVQLYEKDVIAAIRTKIEETQGKY